MADRSRLAINTITTKPLDLEQAIRLYSDRGIPAFSPWHDGVDALGVQQVVSLSRELGISVNGLCLCGLISNEGRAGRQRALDENRRRLDVAAELGCSFVVTVAGGLLPDSKNLEEAAAYSLETLSELLQHARSVGVKLALEPLHPMYCADWSIVTRLRQANDWCDQLGDGAGVVIDTYHVWWDPELETEIARAGTADRLLAFHISDWLVPTKDILLDRGLMGDGVIDFPAIDRMMSNAGYEGYIEVEIFSDTWWSSEQPVFVDAIIDRFVSTV